MQAKYYKLLKIAKLIPLHKSRSEFDENHYRPISPLVNFSEFIERFMYNLKITI